MSINFVAWHDRDAANHQKELDKAAAQGFRTVSLCVYGERNDPRYAAVMVKRPKVHAAQQFIGDANQFQEKFNEMSAKGFGPYVVTATGPANNPLIAASFRPMTATPLTRHGITQQELWQLNLDAWRAGLIPASIDAYGTPGDVRYIAVWHPNPARIAWNLEAVRDPTDLATFQARYNAITAQGGRPTFFTMTPENKYLGLFVDNAIGSWVSRGDLTSAKYQQELDAQVADGQAPIYVTAQGSGANTRFSVIFADREEPIAQVFTPSTSTDAVAGIDSAMEKFIKDHSIHGCALAITLGARLVYAKGYTNAAPGYPAVEPTTLFRIASMSKTFVTAAIYRLVQKGVKTPDGEKFTLDTTMQSVLDLKTPDGGDPVSPQFKKIKIRHLLESTSALEQSLMTWRHVEAAQKFGSNEPCTPAQLASLCAATSLQKDDKGNEKTPGDTTNVVYGNTDYFMLSQVVARLCDTETFEEALKQLILKPLGIKRVRGSRSAQSAQASDEALYHTTNINPEPVVDKDGKTVGFTEDVYSLWICPDSMSTDHALVPQPYGDYNYEILDGCGGLSGAATDIARLMAALSLRKNNPVFSETTLDNWFQNTLTATGFTGPSAHGYHGFDWGKVWDTNKPFTAPGNFVTSKGGWLPSHSSVFTFTAGGLGFVVVTNNGGQADIKTDWYVGEKKADGTPAADSVFSVAFFHDWKTIDLFPQFGMSSFKTTSFSTAIFGIDPTEILTFSKKIDLPEILKTFSKKIDSPEILRFLKKIDSPERLKTFSKKIDSPEILRFLKRIDSPEILIFSKKIDSSELSTFSKNFRGVNLRVRNTMTKQRAESLRRESRFVVKK
jgi:CubicO group peptidase (beta-lactamase class C family)